MDGPEFDGHGVNFDELLDRLSAYREYEQKSLACAEDNAVSSRASPVNTTESDVFMPTKITTKERLPINRQKMPEQDSTARAANFEEVNLGFTEQFALLEADRCIQCKDPRCMAGCPVNVNIPRFIDWYRKADLQAAQSLLADNALPAITGRVCPQETQCEEVCVRGAKGTPVGIGYLERYVADWARIIRIN